MKSLIPIVVITSLVVLSFGPAHAQTEFSLDHVDGLLTPTTIMTGVDIKFHIRMTNIGCGNIMGYTSGFRIYSPDGARWDSTTAELKPGVDWTNMFDLIHGIYPFGITGSEADTIGFGGAKMFKDGIPDGFDEVVYEISTKVAHSESGKTICIDSAFYPPGGYFLWSTDGCDAFTPGWDGPHCFDLLEPSNYPPEMTNCPTELNVDHCSPATHTFTAVDPEGDNFVFEQTAGPGIIDTATGEWLFIPTLADVGSPILISVNGNDGLAGASCNLTLNITNVAPSIVCPVETVTVGKGNTVWVPVDASSNDCDPLSFNLIGVTPTPVGVVTVDPNTGRVTFETDDADADSSVVYAITVEVTDGNMSATCDVMITVFPIEPFEVQIERTHRTVQGGHESVDITLNKGSIAMGGFDFLVGYDASALSFHSAVPGEIPSDCGWEYFTYRYSHQGNCGEQCPSGQVRLVGIAETNSNPGHPTCFNGPDGSTLLTLDFLVSNDNNLVCRGLPIRFVWYDCTDNTISSKFGDSLFISRSVMEWDQYTNIADPEGDSYPTYAGAGITCTAGDKNIPARFIDFVNGSVEILCMDAIDDRGDINLNGIAYEVADAVVFSNYFIVGLDAFSISMAGQVAATDVNADDITLTVADLVYLIRVVIGDASPYPISNGKLSPVSASYSVSDAISVDAEMGAVAIVANGFVTPQLLAGNMEMGYNYDTVEDVTRILVYSLEGNSFSGEFLAGVNDIQSIEFATDEGAQVVTRKIPTNFTLNQNYPNPFNPSTTISASLPVASEYNLTIYNITGQKVAEFDGSQEAGELVIEWDASNVASGIYFYKLNAGSFSATRKMVLLK